MLVSRQLLFRNETGVYQQSHQTQHILYGRFGYNMLLCEHKSCWLTNVVYFVQGQASFIISSLCSNLASFTLPASIFTLYTKLLLKTPVNHPVKTHLDIFIQIDRFCLIRTVFYCPDFSVGSKLGQPVTIYFCMDEKKKPQHGNQLAL